VMNSMDALDVSAKVTAKQIAENANNLQRAEAAEARAEAAEEKVSEYAKALLLVEMRYISEEAYCAGWMLGLEWACMDIIAGRISNYGLLADFDLHKRMLEELHKFAGGWWMWRDGDQEETFVLDAGIVNYKVERR